MLQQTHLPAAPAAHTGCMADLTTQAACQSATAYVTETVCFHHTCCMPAQGVERAQRQRHHAVLTGRPSAEWGQGQCCQSVGHGCLGVPQNPGGPQGRCALHCRAQAAAPFLTPS